MTAETWNNTCSDIKPCRFRTRCNRQCSEMTQTHANGFVSIKNQYLDEIMPNCTLFGTTHRFADTFVWFLENLLAKYGINRIEDCEFFGEIGLKIAERWVTGYMPTRTKEEMQKLCTSHYDKFRRNKILKTIP